MGEIIFRDEQFMLKKKKVLQQVFMRHVVIIGIFVLLFVYYNLDQGPWGCRAKPRLTGDYFSMRYLELIKFTIVYSIIMTLSFSSVIKLYTFRKFIRKSLVYKSFILHSAFVVIIILMIIAKYKSMGVPLPW